MCGEFTFETQRYAKQTNMYRAKVATENIVGLMILAGAVFIKLRMWIGCRCPGMNNVDDDDGDDKYAMCSL